MAVGGIGVGAGIRVIGAVGLGLGADGCVAVAGGCKVTEADDEAGGAGSGAHAAANATTARNTAQRSARPHLFTRRSLLSAFSD